LPGLSSLLLEPSRRFSPACFDLTAASGQREGRGHRGFACGRVVGLIAAAAGWELAGCAGLDQPAGVLSARSLGRDPVALTCRPVTAFYADAASPATSLYFADVALEDLLLGRIDRGIVVHIELLWVPKPGATPMDSTATNVGICCAVFADGEVGVYGGAGFGLPGGRVGGRLRIALQDASLTLLDSTEGFVDLLSPSRLSGSITATYNPPRVRQIQHAVSQLVTNALGRSRLVQVVPAGAPAASMAGRSAGARRRVDPIDPDPQIRLAVPDLAAIALAAPEADDADLVAGHLPQDLRGDGGAGHVGCADRRRVSVVAAHQQHAVECDPSGLAEVAGIDVQDVSRCDPHLRPAVLDDGVHGGCLDEGRDCNAPAACSAR
jgi:hypothetical protein